MPDPQPVFIGSSTAPKPPSSAADTRTDELARVNEAMYKQNLELSIRNKTLSVLRSISDITMRATSVASVTQLIVDVIARELAEPAAFIFSVDKQAGLLRLSAINQSPQTAEGFKLLGELEEHRAIPIDYANNLAINAILDKEQKITGNLLDILTPVADQEVSDKIEQLTGIKTIIIYPLLLADRALGVLCLGLAKNVDELSRAEKETLHEVIGVVSIAIDRAELLENIRKANEDLQKANEQLEVLDKLKDEFVSVASHELRTPMTAIKSYAWMMVNGKGGILEPKAKEYMDKIYNSTDRLIHLVNEMLDVSRIESGRVKLLITHLDPLKLLSDVQSEFQARAAENNIHLEVHPDGDIPLVEADVEKIHQVLENLVGNAFKFTPSGGSVTLTAKKTDGQVEFRVIDNGKGIDKDDFPKLFHKFGRLENSLVSLSNDSTGLGLYICRQYIELHKGKIWVESEVGKGTTAIFTLPIANAP